MMRIRISGEASDVIAFASWLQDRDYPFRVNMIKTYNRTRRDDRVDVYADVKDVTR